MENIKSFREWYFATNNSEDKIIDFLSEHLIKDEMELAEHLRDISLEHQDNGCNFEFTIYFINKNSRYPLSKSKNSDEWILDKRILREIHDKLRYQNDEDIYNHSTSQVSIMGNRILKEDLDDFIKTLRSHFSDVWTMDIFIYRHNNPGGKDHEYENPEDALMFDFDINITKIDSEYHRKDIYLWKRKNIK